MRLCWVRGQGSIYQSHKDKVPGSTWIEGGYGTQRSLFYLIPEKISLDFHAFAKSWACLFPSGRFQSGI